jgi:hypothetical protein
MSPRLVPDPADQIGVNRYSLLARALLDVGDSPTSIATFLSVEYGLDAEQARTALVLADSITRDDESRVLAAEERAAHR